MHSCALSVEVLVGVRIVRSHASVHVVLGVRLVVLSVPLIVVHFVSQFSYCISSSNSFP